MRNANRLFDDLNKKYWCGRLQKYRVICRVKIPGDLLGCCRDKAKTIWLRKDLSEEDFRLTLLHEMCHIGASDRGDAHGPRFLRKLQRLARLGEPKLLEDIERYDGTDVKRFIAQREAETGETLPTMPWRVALCSDLEAAASDAEVWRHRWPKVRRWLAEKYRMTEARLERRAPWAEREWRQLSYDARSEVRLQQARSERRLPPRYRPLRNRVKATAK